MEDAVLARIVIGLVISLLGFAIAGRRFFWLSRLIRTGKEAPRRWNGFRRVTEAELVEVAGQRKLLRWTIPGLAHFFTMWGFFVLLATIIEAYGALFNRNFHIPWIGQSNWLAFVEDFFSTAVLVSLIVFSVIRLVNAPSRKDRASRFYGSHLKAAWITLSMIAMVNPTIVMTSPMTIRAITASSISSRASGSRRSSSVPSSGPEVLPISTRGRSPLTAVLRPETSRPVGAIGRGGHLEETDLTDLHTRVQGDGQVRHVRQFEREVAIPTRVDEPSRRVDQ